MLFAIVMLFSIFAATYISAAEYVKETPVDSNKWETARFDDPDDYAYSFAFVGDTQFITIGDYLLGTEKLKAQYKFIADTAEERKLEHVFVLGDMTDWGYRNDSNLASMHYPIPKTGEWDKVKEAISQLDGVVPYSLVRGNHDDYMMDDYFNVPEYTSMFEGCGGFYSDSEGTQPQKKEPMNPDNCIYWSATTGCHDESIVNSWKTVEISGTKYLFITHDYNPTKNVMAWLDEILAQFPDHKAIITCHSYLMEDGTPATPEEELGNTNNYLGNSGSVLWEQIYRKHANVFMIVSGHTGDEYVNFSYNRGDNGNKVLQVLVDPQCYETRETDSKGTLQSGKQDIGMVLYMNFSADGKRISFNNYSTLLGKFLKNQNFVINLEGDIVDGTGYIDMASFDSTTPLVADMTAVNLDGSITDGEYTSFRTYTNHDMAKGTLTGEFTEYFAYDNDFIYYAFTTQATGLLQYKLTLHMGSALYTREQLNRGDHTLYADYEFSNGTFKLTTNNTQASTPIDEYNDLACSATYDKTSKIATYELRIRRGYLRDNGSPDNLLSYKLTMGGVEHYFKLSEDAKTAISELGVEKKFIMTYNYAYFGSRPVAGAVPPLTTEPPATEEPAATTVVDDASTGCGGCGSSMGIAAVAIVPVIAGVAMIGRKKKED